MSEQPKLGQIHEYAQGRDAVHVAVAPAVAMELLRPGEHVGLVVGTADVFSASAPELIGIVDPFLRTVLKQGQRFFVFLYPGTITGLRHVWMHPSFPALEGEAAAEFDKKATAEHYLRGFADRAGLSYDALVVGLREFILNGKPSDRGTWWDSDAEIRFGHDLPDFMFKESDQMWRAFSVVTGVEVPELAAKHGSPFSCAC